MGESHYRGFSFFCNLPSVDDGFDVVRRWLPEMDVALVMGVAEGVHGVIVAVIT